MRLIVTANGPGEVAGWVRPLLAALYARSPDSDVTVVLVPDDYATGHEASFVRTQFAQARVLDPKQYLRLAFGGSIAGLAPRADIVQYLGGDLMHALRLRRRFGARAATYKFARARARGEFERAFAVDEANAGQLRDAGMPEDRVQIVGNLAIDGALMEGAMPPEPGTPDDGVLFMPGSRPYEVDNMVPFFFTAALRMLREQPSLALAFGISPFTEIAALRRAVELGGAELMWSERGRVIEADGRAYVATMDGEIRIPVVRRALAAARRARLAVTLPGTKCIELAALGVPTVAVTPMNVPEKVTVNGPLTYVDRVPFLGKPLKRAVVVAVAKRFTYHTQPNMDAGAPVMRELHGTLTPGRVARETLAAYDDVPWRVSSKARLVDLYRDHVGASGRMAEALVQLAEAG